MQNFTLHIKYFDIKGYNPIFGIYWSVHIKENEKVDLDSFILKTPYNDKLQVVPTKAIFGKINTLSRGLVVTGRQVDR